MSDNKSFEEAQTAEVPQFPINQHLLEEATHIKEEWRVIRDRLEKIEASRSQVSPSVYERVKGDYQSKLEEVTKALMDKKQDIDGELENLYMTRSKIAEQLEEQRQSLEEVKFRHMLGEFNEDEYQSRGKEKQDRISKFESAMQAVTMNISRYESIFHEEAEILGVESASPDIEEAVQKGASAASVMMEHPEENIGKGAPHAAISEETGEHLETDEEGYIINEHEGPDYFSSVENTGKTPPPTNAEESSTMKTQAGAPSQAQKGLPRARVVIISGDMAGAAYPLKDTVSMGRADSNTIALKDAKISRQHAQIQQHGNQFILVDLNSSNGTYVNGQRIEEHVLQNNDEIQVGDYILQFQE